jgi:hypothetical protein
MSPAGSPNSSRTRACHSDVDLFPFPFNYCFPITSSFLLVATTCSSPDCQVHQRSHSIFNQPAFMSNPGQRRRPPFPDLRQAKYIQRSCPTPASDGDPHSLTSVKRNISSTLQNDSHLRKKYTTAKRVQPLDSETNHSPSQQNFPIPTRFGSIRQPCIPHVRW